MVVEKAGRRLKKESSFVRSTLFYAVMTVIVIVNLIGAGGLLAMIYILFAEGLD